MEKDKSENKPQQLKRFSFFNVQTIQEKIPDISSHPITFSQLQIKDIKSIYPKLYILDAQPEKNSIYVFTNYIIGEWKPHTDSTLLMQTNTKLDGGILVTYGVDSENQMKSTYFKFWEVSEVVDYAKIKPRKVILVGQLSSPDLNISCIFLLKDLTTMAVGSKKGTILIYQSKNLLLNDPKTSTKPLQKKEIKSIKISRRSNEIDIYFTTQDTFYWLQNLSEKRKISQQEMEALDLSERGTIICAAKNDRKTIYQYDLSRPIKNWTFQGEKILLKCFKENYLIIVTCERKNEKVDKPLEKYNVQIFDTLNLYLAYYQTFSRVQFIITSFENIFIVSKSSKGINDERNLIKLTQKENAFKIQTFFKKSFFNEAWRFAKNQNSDPSLLAQISRLHGDLLYSKSDFPGAIKQYILTLGFVEPSYVIRRFLDVSQIQYLIQYLENIHAKKIAKRQHTALLLNCYVKQQKIENLSNFLSQSSVESDLFDIQTAIKVCRQLNHTDLAIKLAEQKKQDQFYLKILIEDKKDYDRALDHIKTKVQLQQKQKYILEFGQQLMKYNPKKLIQLIELIVKTSSISVRMKQKDAVLTKDDKQTLEALNCTQQNIENLVTITFKKPDEFLRLFLVNNQDLQNFLNFMLKVQKLPNEQVIYHRLFQFYLQKILEYKQSKQQNQKKIQQYQEKIMQNLQSQQRKYDKNHLLVLFKMYQFDLGIIYLCKILEMRDDLLNFYIGKKKDKEIIELCKMYGGQQVNLWIHALKYFAKPQNRKQSYIPEILTYLEQIYTLSPLLILSILSKNKNIEYKFVKSFFLNKLKQDRKQIEKDREVVNKNIKKVEQSRNQYKKLKTMAKPFQSNHCVQCLNNLTFPSIHFMCGHSFHENCLGGERQCSKCGFQIKSIIERKSRFEQQRGDNKKLFQNLEERRNNPFQVISEFMGKGLFPKEFLKR